ncbi:MAG: DNA polymerase III subunit gamma/tau [Chloroflexi bacterium]|jgi:DNA polymerase-3 subunit gamma/tau|nr:DNA polymerase III subunit gamma/tau [Anaerolineaceae bacterium]NLI43973.1 DNA polymerase III subunit gamma/tau [Chloroflexota bacterium]HOE35371.1 DNA polymerase III subunit gamma/tau [Anaerolineaceae bacterium]HOT26061.1 DNA polymerase III subunit gamma/tau [Anaerolineaceae bacterium]HQH58182.1 DNA polymerase III subunit gamma/tau [Anaerolineaceae bacterium]
MSQALYRTWRPSSWDEVAGQEHIVQTLRNAVLANRVSQAYLFAGPRGTGKTTSARLLAKAVNCLAENPKDRPCNACENCIAVNQGRFLDLIEIDAASNTSVDDVRELRDTINFAPSQGKYKVYIIDEVHMLSTSAFNALLKTLEEPPSHVIFILATTEIHKIPATVLSRCQRHEFRRIPLNQIIEKLRQICARENIEVDDDALSLIARQSTGSMRDAISLVDQLASLESRVTLASAQDILGTATSQTVIDLVQAILEKDSARGLGLIHTALDSGADPRQFARQVVDYLRSLLVVKLNGGKDLELLPEVRSVVNKQAGVFSAAELINGINDFSKAAVELKANWHPGLGLELAFAKAVSAAAAPAAETRSAPPVPAASAPKETSHNKNSAESQKEAKPVSKPAAQQQSTETAPEPEQRGGGELNLENLLQDWEKIKRDVRSVDQVASALLNSSRIIRVENGTITLGFKSDLLRDKMNEEKTLRAVRGVLAKYYRKEVMIACTAGTQVSEEEHPDIIPNGLVDVAVRELGGRVSKKTENKEKKD